MEGKQKATSQSKSFELCHQQEHFLFQFRFLIQPLPLYKLQTTKGFNYRVLVKLQIKWFNPAGVGGRWDTSTPDCIGGYAWLYPVGVQNEVSFRSEEHTSELQSRGHLV